MTKQNENKDLKGKGKATTIEELNSSRLSNEIIEEISENEEELIEELENSPLSNKTVEEIDIKSEVSKIDKIHNDISNNGECSNSSINNEIDRELELNSSSNIKENSSNNNIREEEISSSSSNALIVQNLNTSLQKSKDSLNSQLEKFKKGKELILTEFNERINQQTCDVVRKSHQLEYDLKGSVELLVSATPFVGNVYYLGKKINEKVNASSGNIVDSNLQLIIQTASNEIGTSIDNITDSIQIITQNYQNELEKNNRIFFGILGSKDAENKAILSEKDSQIDALNKRKEDLETRINNLNNDISSIKEGLNDEYQVLLNQETNSFNQIISEKENKIKQNQQIINNLIEQRKAIEEAQLLAEIQREKLIKEGKALNSAESIKLEAITKEYDELASQLTSHEELLKNEKARVEWLIKIIERNNLEFDNYEVAQKLLIHNFQDELIRVNAKVKALEDEKIILMTELEQLQQRINELTTENERLDNLSKQRFDIITNYMVKESSYKSEIAKLEGIERECEQIKLDWKESNKQGLAILKERTAEKVKAELELEDKKNDCEILKIEKDSLDRKIIKLEKRNEELEKELDKGNIFYDAYENIISSAPAKYVINKIEGKVWTFIPIVLFLINLFIFLTQEATRKLIYTLTFSASLLLIKHYSPETFIVHNLIYSALIPIIIYLSYYLIKWTIKFFIYVYQKAKVKFSKKEEVIELETIKENNQRSVQSIAQSNNDINQFINLINNNKNLFQNKEFINLMKELNNSEDSTEIQTKKVVKKPTLKRKL